ncbi:SRPBCC family protein [Tumebacillus sp. ITR2]|uniref:SRPBCC family protein n=1 Tax=Tumebacillus amylolyticus TaxID=2801339 RepID=A0ABS1J4L2_9BACL|nr:SRPBCC family protein [Tumebacillus amylolyticus]MBL0385208.1 SRPBCC family protein [Tumebacillus amylolyticus]
MKATATKILPHGIHEVFTFVSNPDTMHRWVDGVSNPRRTSDAELGVGLTFATHYAFNGRQAEIDYVITEFEAPHRYGIKATSGPFPFASEVLLEEVPEGTSMTYTIDAGSDSKATSVIFALFGPLLRKAMVKRLHRQLEDLKALV